MVKFTDFYTISTTVYYTTIPTSCCSAIPTSIFMNISMLLVMYVKCGCEILICCPSASVMSLLYFLGIRWAL